MKVVTPFGQPDTPDYRVKTGKKCQVKVVTLLGLEKHSDDRYIIRGIFY